MMIDNPKPMSNRWILETKKSAAINGKSYKETLQDKDHRIRYHRDACDPAKMFRGGTLLPYNHPAMTTTIIMPTDYSTPTTAVLHERAKAIELSKQNTITCLKMLLKKNK